MKKYNIYFLGFIIITSIAVSYLNFIRYQSFKVQYEIYTDRVSGRDRSERSIEWIESINTEYPTLGLFTMPLLSHKGEYLIAKDSIGQAIQAYEKAIERNPFIMHPEAQLADTYYRLGDFGKFEKYTRYSFKNLPNNPLHFVHLVRLFKMQNKVDSIIHYFNKVEKILGPKDVQVYNIVLSALVQSQDTVDKYGGQEIAKRALSIFPVKAKPIHDYIMYTRENLIIANQKHEEAKKLFNEGKTDISLELFEESINLHPNNQLYYDNYISANIELNNYNKILIIYDDYLKYFTDIKPKIFFYFAASFYFEDKYQLSCSLLNELLETNSFAFDKSVFPICFKI